MKKKILVVDDDADIRFSVMDGLNMVTSGFEFIEAENGKVAFEKLKTTFVDLIILDIMMPVMDGWELAAKLKEDPKLEQIPILFLSAKTDEYSKALGRQTAADYIEKPFEINDLKAKIEEILGK
jgi:DNA-binding response OmpR family regulator